MSLLAYLPVAGGRAHLFEVVAGAAYPVLGALTAALYLALLLLLLREIPALLRAAGLLLPPAWAGFSAPVLLLTLLVAPIPFGPLWCLFMWGLLVMTVLGTARPLAGSAGLILILWGGALEVRERLFHWLADPGVAVMLEVMDGAAPADGSGRIGELMARHPDDPVPRYTLAQLRRRSGDLAGAGELLADGPIWRGLEGWVRGEQAGIAFLAGRPGDAAALLDAASSRGLDSADFHLNASLIRFELLDTVGSVRHLEAAARREPGLTGRLGEVAGEESKAGESRGTIVDLVLPLRAVVSSALRGSPDSEAAARQRAAHLMAGRGPVGIAALGGLLFLGALIPIRPRWRGYFPFWGAWRPGPALHALIGLIPGGPLIWSGRPLVGAALLALIVLLGAPLVPIAGWSPPWTGSLSLFVGVTITAVGVGWCSARGWRR